ncbi:MAG TPA: FecR family protein [Prolixibacteraceae bacterium]|nr:FecR family protein [Prolixibacteraceae bacterium]
MNKNDLQYWDLIAGKLHNELDSKENALFENGIEEPSNQNHFAKSQKNQEGLKEVKQLQKSDKNASWNTIAKKVRMKTIETYSKNFLKYAAILVVAFIAGTYFHSLNKSGNQEVQYAEMEVMYGQTGHLFLFDGTEVWLNSGTKFKYPNQFNQGERNVFLEGEAFFKVAPNKHLPFKVKTGKLEIEVLGTSFNVSAYPDESSQSVVLVEGKVQLNTPEGMKIGEMVPGQIAVKSESDAIIQVKNIDPYSYTNWKDGKITFNGDKLGDIAKKMERWYNIEIRFEMESFRNYKFSGTILRNKPIDQTIKAMELLAPIRFNYEIKAEEKSIITIRKKK